MNKINSLIILFFMSVWNTQSATAFFPSNTSSQTSSSDPEDWARYQQLQQERVRKIAERIIETLSDEEKQRAQKIQYYVTLDSKANAGVTFGKKMIVHKGLLDFIQNDDELAFVVGHEI